MRIVITGAGGFVGRRIVQMLRANGHMCTGIDTVADGMIADSCCVVGDLADAAVRARAPEQGGDAIIHLATVPGGAERAGFADDGELARLVTCS